MIDDGVFILVGAWFILNGGVWWWVYFGSWWVVGSGG